MKFLSLPLAALVLTLASCSPTVSLPETRDVSISEAAEFLKNIEHIVVLDIRTPEEFEKGHLKGAQLIDFLADDFETKISALDKNVTYLMHCASGGRSGEAMSKFQEAGFISILHLTEGFKGWEAAGMPVDH